MNSTTELHFRASIFYFAKVLLVKKTTVDQIECVLSNELQLILLVPKKKVYVHQNRHVQLQAFSRLVELHELEIQERDSTFFK